MKKIWELSSLIFIKKNSRSMWLVILIHKGKIVTDWIVSNTFCFFSLNHSFLPLFWIILKNEDIIPTSDVRWYFSLKWNFKQKCERLYVATWAVRSAIIFLSMGIKCHSIWHRVRHNIASTCATKQTLIKVNILVFFGI